MERASPDEEMEVSLYFRPGSGREGAIVSREEMRERRETEMGGDLGLIGSFARAEGLRIVLGDPARLLVKLRGSVASMEKAFGTELYDVDIGGKTCKARQGALSIPTDLMGRVEAVLGLDTAPVAAARDATSES